MVLKNTNLYFPPLGISGDNTKVNLRVTESGFLKISKVFIFGKKKFKFGAWLNLRNFPGHSKNEDLNSPVFNLKKIKIRPLR